MKNPSFTESEQMAIMAELASPLVHESNNFLNNFFLHMALFQEHLPDQLRADCDSVRREGKKLEQLLRQWQGNRRACFDQIGKIELNELITEIADQLRLIDGPARFTLSLCSEPLWLHGPTGKFKRFCQLWLQSALEIKQALDGQDGSPLAIQTGRTDDRIKLHVLNVGLAASPDGQADFVDGDRSDLLLPMAACKALARHIRGNIGMEQGPQGQRHLVVEFS